MKQRRIKELQVNHYEGGGSVNYSPSREEEYAAVLAQAEAHQDLRFHTEINSEEVLIILPWESVIGVYATYETADVPAPTDAICDEGGEAQGRLVVTVNEPMGDITLYDDDGCFVTPPSFYSGITATFDGVPLTEQQMWQDLRMEVLGMTDGKIAVDCDATSVTYTTVFTYEGETCIVTVTQNTTASDG